MTRYGLANTTAANKICDRGHCPPFSLLLRLLELPDGFFEAEVLRRLGPAALASLAGAGRSFFQAVTATALMKWADHEKKVPRFSMVPPRSYNPSFHPPSPHLCVREACALAAGGGHLEVLQWLHNTGCPRDRRSDYAAAAGGHLEVLQWLRITGRPWNSSTWGLCAEVAAKGGYLEVLKWLHGNGWVTAVVRLESGENLPTVVVAEMVCSNAAIGGHLEVLKWVREHGCPWKKQRVRTNAAMGGHVEMLRWLDGQGVP
jgi:hypothetical protein